MKMPKLKNFSGDWRSYNDVADYIDKVWSYLKEMMEYKHSLNRYSGKTQEKICKKCGKFAKHYLRKTGTPNSRCIECTKLKLHNRFKSSSDMSD